MKAGILLIAATALLVTLAVDWTDFKRLQYGGFGRRDPWQHPERVIDALEIQPGAHVADLGANGGYFTFRLADAVGPGGRVYAVDVDSGMIDHLAERVRDERRPNVETILARHDDSRLPKGAVDLIFVCNTYHHIGDRTVYFARLSTRLRPGGRVAIVDYRPFGWPGGWLGRLSGEFVLDEVIRSQMEAAGYALERVHDFLPRQYFLVFAPRSSATIQRGQKG